MRDKGGRSWIWVLGLIVVLLVAPVGGTMSGRTEGSDDPVSPPMQGTGDDGLRDEDFSWYSASELPSKLDRLGEEGNIRVPGPGGEDIVLRLKERPGDIFEEGDNRWKIVDRQGNVVEEGIIRYRSFEGTVAGSPTSDVYIYWDRSDFATGVIEVDGWHATIQDDAPTAAPGLESPVIGWRRTPPSAQTNVQSEGLLQPGPLDHSVGHCSTIRNSRVRYAAEKRFINNEPDWHNWITSAHDFTDAKWGDLCIDPYYDVWGHDYNIADTDSCSPSSYNVVDAFQNHLQNSGHTTSSVDAYQLVTGRNLEGGCHGLANKKKLGGYLAASVIEGIDYCCDAYNADLQKQRGILSAHERGHQHGSSHYNDCKETNAFGGRTKCNIMCCTPDQALWNFDDYSKWWTQGTYDEVSAYAWGRL